MKAETRKISIRELTDGTYSVNEDGTLVDYESAGNAEDFGALAMNGTLVVRPSYQRNFVWSLRQQQKLIESILKGWMINPLVFAKVGDHYECVDGQQRTLSLCNYRYNLIDYLDNAPFANHSKKHQDAFLDYELDVRIVEYDNDVEKIEHFTAINQPITVLTRQELRNATYNGTFVESLKDWFGRRTCKMKRNGFADKYIKLTDVRNGVTYDKVDRQELTEIAILWTLVLTDDDLYGRLMMSGNKDHSLDVDKDEIYDTLIRNYMRAHKDDFNANEVVNNFMNIITWIDNTFGSFTNNQMRNVKNWAYLYRTYKNVKFDTVRMSSQLRSLMSDPEIHHKHSIPEFLLITNSNPNLSNEEIDGYAHKMLSLQSFPEDMRRNAYYNQSGKCADCGEPLAIEYLEPHHIVAWSLGGKTIPENLVMLCPHCHGLRHNYRKVNKESA